MSMKRVLARNGAAEIDLAAAVAAHPRAAAVAVVSENAGNHAGNTRVAATAALTGSRSDKKLGLRVDGRIAGFFPDPRTVGPHHAGVSIVVESGHENLVMNSGDQA